MAWAERLGRHVLNLAQHSFLINRCWVNQRILWEIYKSRKQMREETTSEPRCWRVEKVGDEIYSCDACSYGSQHQSSPRRPIVLGVNPKDSRQQVRYRQRFQVAGPNRQVTLRVPKLNNINSNTCQAGANPKTANLREQIPMDEIIVHHKIVQTWRSKKQRCFCVG